MPQPSQFDSLSPEKLQLFAASLAGLPHDEIRQAKTLYIRNAISEYRALNESLRAFGCVQVFFMLIPFFWPFIYAQKRLMASQRRLAEERIRNAMAVWKDDLAGQSFDLTVFTREP